MVDEGSVRRHLQEIGIRLRDLRPILKSGKSRFVDDRDHRELATFRLQQAIESALDVAAHIIAEDTDQTPEDYGSTFVILGKIGVLDHELAERLRSASGLRNIIVHDYVDVDPDRVWQALEQLEDLRAFSEAIERYLEKA